VTVDVEEQEVRFGDRVVKATMPDGPATSSSERRGIRWVLLEAGAAIEATSKKLPYVGGF
jgi:hypothetical protein